MIHKHIPEPIAQLIDELGYGPCMKCYYNSKLVDCTTDNIRMDDNFYFAPTYEEACKWLGDVYGMTPGACLVDGFWHPTTNGELNSCTGTYATEQEALDMALVYILFKIYSKPQNSIQ